VTIEPYHSPGPFENAPAYTLPELGVQIPVAEVDRLTLKEVEARAWTMHPYAEEGHAPDSIWAGIWIDRLTSAL
jgi:hypothetical protein